MCGRLWPFGVNYCFSLRFLGRLAREKQELANGLDFFVSFSSRKKKNEKKIRNSRRGAEQIFP
jgi:hypothetical protein